MGRILRLLKKGMDFEFGKTKHESIEAEQADIETMEVGGLNYTPKTIYFERGTIGNGVTETVVIPAPPDVIDSEKDLNIKLSLTADQRNGGGTYVQVNDETTGYINRYRDGDGITSESRDEWRMMQGGGGGSSTHTKSMWSGTISYRPTRRFSVFGNGTSGRFNNPTLIQGQLTGPENEPLNELHIQYDPESSDSTLRYAVGWEVVNL